MRPRLVWALIAGLIALVLLTVAGFFGDAAWWLDLWANFRAQYIVAAGVCAAAFAALARWKLATMAIVVMALNGWIVGPLQLTDGPIDTLAATPTLKIVTFNLQFSNDNYEAVREFFRSERPDIVVLQEVTERWAQELELLAVEFPHRLVSAHPDWRGVALLSRNPWEAADLIGDLNSTPVAAVNARFSVQGSAFSIIGFKTLPPTSQVWAAGRDRQLTEIGMLAARSAEPVILAGDFNATPWSRGYAALIRESRLSWDAGRYLPTWHVFFGPLGIQIDHVLAGSPLRIGSKKSGPYLGSDHYPVVATIEFRQNDPAGR